MTQSHAFTQFLNSSDATGVTGSNVTDRETLRALAMMTNNTFLGPGEEGGGMIWARIGIR